MKLWWTNKYQPTPEFVEDLKGLDENLLVFWDGLDNNWVIVRHGKMGYHEVAHYQYLDNRVLKSLYEGDLWRTTPKKLDDYLTEHKAKLDREKKNYLHESAMEVGRRAYVDGGIREHKTQF
jgi:hypothetical protein